jgi:uncharacterized protein (TIGR03435 family)
MHIPRELLPIALLLRVSPAAAQAPPEFEVASIRPHPGGDNGSSNTKVSPGGRLSAINVTVRKMIRNAFDVEDFQISGAPRWIDSASYDIEAKTTRTTRDDISRLILSLLQERFQMRYHRTTRELTEYALEVAGNGPKLESHTGSDETFTSMNSHAGIITLKAKRISMEDFAYSLRRQLGRPVIDRTGLTGEFDLDLTWSSEQAADSNEPSVFTALQKIGLRLVSMKGPVEMIVIDEVEKASEN